MLKITDKLNEIKTAKANIKNSIEAKGVTVGDDIREFPNAINSIETGIFPEGTLEITENGIHDVTNYKEIKADIHEPTAYAPRYVSFRDYTGTELDEEIRNLDTSNMTSLIAMFRDTSLKRLDLSNFNTENVISFEELCYGSTSLEEINVNNLNTSKLTTMTNTFADMPKLKNLDISDFDMSEVTGLSYIFNGTPLETFRLGTNLGKGYTQKRNNYSRYKLDLSVSNLDHDSLMDVINKLYDLNLTYDVANGGTAYTQQLVLGATNIAKLSSDELAIATNKNWVVS